MPQRIGLIVTPDNANDRDFWRYCPSRATLHFTRTEFTKLTDCCSDSVDAARDENLVYGTRAFIPIDVAVSVFACTSGSFLRGLHDERRIRRTMDHAGAKIAVTTSGAILDALSALGARAVAVGTPYDQPCTEKLGTFLQEAGFSVVSIDNQPPKPDRAIGISDMTASEVLELAMRVDRQDADVLLLSCAGLGTYDVVEGLERDLGKPVLTSVQATMWAALGAAGVAADGVHQELFKYPWNASPIRLG
jgi:maleate isomerase